MDDKIVSLEIGKEVVRPILEKHIATAITAALGGTDDMIERMVHLALSKKVGRDGRPSKYSNDNKYDFVEAVAGKTIRDAAQEGLREWAKENGEKIKAVIIKEMMKPASSRKIAKAFAEAAVSSISVSWKPYIDISFTPHKDH